MNQQDIVWIRLPFSSLKESKVRPAVVVSKTSYNNRSKDIIVCAITSKSTEFPYNITIESKDLSQGRLSIRSRIRGDKILQVEKELVIRPFARLSDKKFDFLIRKIISIIQRDN